jgi:hypothetical protein
MKTPLLLTALAGLATPLLAQQPPPPPQQNQNQNQNQSQRPNQGGPRNGQRPPPPQLLIALDANKDGVISADEIANASAALKTLDKNGDGQLTREEFGPPPPPPRRQNNSSNQNPSPDAGGGN